MKDNTRYSPAVVKEEASLRELVINLQSWYNYLKSKRRILAVAAGAGLIAGLSYALMVPPSYVASTSFVLESTKKGMSDYSGIASRLGLNVGGGSNGLFQEDNNIITFMKSRTTISQTLYAEGEFGGKKELLAQRYYEQNEFSKAWKGKAELENMVFHADPAQRNILEDSVISLFCRQILQNNLQVGKPDKDEDVIVATTISPDQLFAKSFNEHLLKNVIDFYIFGQTKKMTENVMILQHQVDSIRGLLNAALSGIASATDANPNPNPAFQRIKVAGQRRMVDVELNKAMLEELVKNLELSKITLRKETPLVQVIDVPVLPLEKKKVGRLKGLIIGFALFEFLTVLWLTILYVFHRLLASED